MIDFMGGSRLTPARRTDFCRLHPDNTAAGVFRCSEGAHPLEMKR
jgi:hypothetical protein